MGALVSIAKKIFLFSNFSLTSIINVHEMKRKVPVILFHKAALE